MNSLVGQRLWKWKLVPGLLTIVLGAIVLAWPGPIISAGLVVLVWPLDSIAVLTLAAGICLTIIGITQIIQAFQTRKAANTARQTIDEAARHATTR